MTDDMAQVASGGERAGRRRERRVQATRGGGPRQLPFAQVPNGYRPIEVMSADQIEAIRPHLATVHGDYVVAFDKLLERVREQRDE